MLYVLFGVLLLGLIMFVFLRGKSGLEREKTLTTALQDIPQSKLKA